jgi:uncharacterized protein with NRDE domain
MCLAVVALHAHPRYHLVVAANRDEFHARAAAPAAWWREGFFAGRDLVAGGTWLGIARNGRWSLLTNVREPQRHDPAAPSRGALVPELMTHAEAPHAALAEIAARSAAYNGFNLLAGAGAQAVWASNRAASMRVLDRDVHGLSNALLDVPWPKVARTRAAVEAWAASGRDDFAPLWTALADRRTAPDAELPETGVTREWERLLSSPFIVSEGYGTRCSTILAIDIDGNARFTERSFDPNGEWIGEVDERFAVTPD